MFGIFCRAQPNKFHLLLANRPLMRPARQTQSSATAANSGCRLPMCAGGGLMNVFLVQRAEQLKQY